MQHIISRKAIFISTPFSKQAVDRLVKFDVPAFKIGSGECNNYPLLEYIASFRKPVILSTGMNNFQSIDTAVSILRKIILNFLYYIVPMFTQHLMIKLDWIVLLILRIDMKMLL